MKNYVYDNDKGYQEFEAVEDAVDLFETMPFESRYTAIGITEDVAATDVVLKQKLRVKKVSRKCQEVIKTKCNSTQEKTSRVCLKISNIKDLS